MSKVQVVWFRDLVRWDIKSNVSLSLQSSHKQVLFEDLLSQAEVEYETLNPNKDYNILGVRSYGLGVYHNRTAKGNTLITKTTKRYQKIQEGNLFWCKVDTKNGAFGVTLTEHIGYYASHNMIQAKINTDKIDLLFLQHLFSCKFFQQFLDSQVTGTTNRQYISFKELLKIKIPLPPLEIQKQIVAKIQSIKAQIKALQEEEKRLKDEIEAYIYIALGLEKKQEAKRQKVFIVRFKDLDRWDTRHNQANQHAKTQIVFENLENLTTYMQRGKTPTYSTIKKYPVIAQKCVQWNGLEIQKALFINPDSLSSYTKERFLQDDDILLNSTGIGTLGRAIIYKSKDNPYNIAVADGHITVMRFDTQRILPQYFYHYFSSALIQDNIEEYATGSTKQKELSLTLIKQIKIPLPPLSVQEKILAHIHKIESSIAATQEKAKALELELTHYIESTL